MTDWFNFAFRSPITVLTGSFEMPTCVVQPDGFFLRERLQLLDRSGGAVFGRDPFRVLPMLDDGENALT